MVCHKVTVYMRPVTEVRGMRGTACVGQSYHGGSVERGRDQIVNRLCYATVSDWRL